MIKKSTIDNPRYQRMLRPQRYGDRVEYLDFMVDFYFKVMLALGHVGFRDVFRAQMSTTLQMMFTKGKSMRQLLDGYRHAGGGIVLNSYADHTILFSVR